jgi:hypothetical protein
MTAPFDFDALERHLVAGCLEAIAIFAKQAPKGDPATIFAIDSNPYYGEFLPSFDTRSRTLAFIRGAQKQALASRDWLEMKEKDAWAASYDGARACAVPMFNNEVGDFSHHMIHECPYDALDAFARSPGYSKLNARAKPAAKKLGRTGNDYDGYIEGHTRAVLARVCDKLVDDGAFAKLELACPFGVGYAYHSEKVTICRVIIGSR